MDQYRYNNMLSSKIGGDIGGAPYTPPSLTATEDMFSEPNPDAPQAEPTEDPTTVTVPPTTSTATDTGNNDWAVVYIIMFIIVIVFCLLLVMFLAYRSTSSPVDQPYYVSRSQLQSAISSYPQSYQ